jgi:hypothetical protein
MPIIHHTTLNLPSRPKPTPEKWNVDYLETVIRQTA